MKDRKRDGDGVRQRLVWWAGVREDLIVGCKKRQKQQNVETAAGNLQRESRKKS